MCSQELSLCRFCVVADADPGALARVVERFQNFNVVPRRVIAEFGTNDSLHIQVDQEILNEERQTAKFEMTQQDLRFLKSLKISMDDAE